MATTLMNDRIPCRYVIVKYVEDEVRDEPVNVGIILQSQRGYTTLCKFISEYSSSKLKNTSSKNILLLKGLSANIERDISSYNEKDSLHRIVSKFEGKLRFTEPTGTLVSDLSNEVQYLFSRYVTTTKPIEDLNRITHEVIKRDVLDFLGTKRYGMVKTHYTFHGKISQFKYDIAILGKVHRYFHTTSFDEQRALQRVKLFDWSVKDNIERDSRLAHKDFAAVISQPTLKNQWYENMIQEYKEATEILSSYDYPFVIYEKDDNSWKRKLEQLLQGLD